MSIRPIVRLVPSLAGALLALAGCAGEDIPTGPSGGGKADELAEDCDDGICLCGDDAAFIAKAQADLRASDPEAYVGEFVDEDASVDYIGDLDNDGMTDLVVNSGMQFSGGNFAHVIYLSGGDAACPSTPAMSIAARSIWVADDLAQTNGTYDLSAVNFGGCTAETYRLAADGKGAYAIAKTESVDLCEEPGPDEDLGGEDQADETIGDEEPRSPL